MRKIQRFCQRGYKVDFNQGRPSCFRSSNPKIVMYYCSPTDGKPVLRIGHTAPAFWYPVERFAMNRILRQTQLNLVSGHECTGG